jgi:hypothetical protein
VKQNPATNELTLETPDDRDIFEQIIQLGYGKQIILTEENKLAILAFAKELNNKELIDACTNFNAAVPQSKLTLKNAVSSLKAKLAVGVNVNDNLEYVAEHFFSIEPKDLYLLDSHTLKRLLAMPALAQRDENTLFNIIFDIVSSKGKSYVQLYDFINFEDLGTEEITRFVNGVNSDSISETAWKSIGRRLISTSAEVQSTSSAPNEEKKAKKKKRAKAADDDDADDDADVDSDDEEPKDDGKTVVFEVGEHPFKGVINSFNTLKGKVAINASSKNTGFLTRIVKADNNTNFWTHNETNSWIRIDFKKATLIPSAYSLSGRCDHDFNQMQSWVFEGLSGKSWKVLDRHSEEPLAKKVPRTFHLKNQTQAFKSFRIRQTGPNTYGDHDLVLSRIELFGTYTKA